MKETDLKETEMLWNYSVAPQISLQKSLKTPKERIVELHEAGQ